MTWDQLAALPPGTRVRFITSWDIFPYCIVPGGMEATVIGQDDLGTWVLPDDWSIRKVLAEWCGRVHLRPELADDPPVQ
jgi:hypothetical protein